MFTFKILIKYYLKALLCVGCNNTVENRKCAPGLTCTNSVCVLDKSKCICKSLISLRNSGSNDKAILQENVHTHIIWQT